MNDPMQLLFNSKFITIRNQKHAPKTIKSKNPKYRNNSHTVDVFEVLQSLRKDKVLCDITLETDDGMTVLGHKVVLISASPYFNKMFISFEDNHNHKDNFVIKELDSKILELLIDYIYTGEIMVTKENVQVLLPAANLLQLHYVQDICCEFLQTLLDPSNCHSIKAFAKFHNCMKLLSSSKAFIKKHFLDVVECDEFLTLSFEDVIKIISCDDLNVPFEEKVFECVINWVEYNINSRKHMLHKLMKQVRLPLVSKKYILKNVLNEPLMKTNSKCKDYIIKALEFHLLKSEPLFSIPKTICFKPRQFSFDNMHKVILVFGWSNKWKNCWTKLYDPATNQWQLAPEMNNPLRRSAGLAIIKHNFMFAVGGVHNCTSSNTVEMLNLSSEFFFCWVESVDMLVHRIRFGVGVLNDCIYAVGGFNGIRDLDEVEVFDVSIQEWRMVSSMSTQRSNHGVGVLDNILYAVGGYNGKQSLKSVECYDPNLDTWVTVAEMAVCRKGVGIGVLDGVIYAVGGQDDGKVFHKSVEAYRPSVGVWTSIADMHLPRKYAGVVAFNGLLYVMGGKHSEHLLDLDSIECYNPKTNTWKIIRTKPIPNGRIYAGAVINCPNYLLSNSI